MGQLDEVSQAIGRLQAGQDQMTALAQRMSDQNERILSKLGDLEASAARNSADIVEMKPHVRHYAGVRRNVKWIVTAITTAAAVGGSLVTHFVEKKFLS